MTSSGTLECRTDGTFHILQVTDFHTDAGDELAERTFDAVRRLVSRHSPDLLAITGDIWCGDDKREAAPQLMERDLRFLGSLGVPWSFAWGNHDFVGDFAKTQEQIAGTVNAVMPPGDGRGSYRIEIVNPESKTPLWDIFFLNSGLQWTLPNDILWFETESARVAGHRECLIPAVVFAHIPLIQYERARIEGRFRGFAFEEVLHWGDNGRVFEAFRNAGNVAACFVGHSHRNDFYVVEDGVLLAYGRVTGYGGYGDELARGAKRILLDGTDHSISGVTVFPDGCTGEPRIHHTPEFTP